MTASPLAAVFAALGVAAAAAAGIWYALLGPRTPPQELRVPRAFGLRESVAVHELTRDGLRVRVQEPRGLHGAAVVVGQYPFPQTTVARGSAVTLRVAARR